MEQHTRAYFRERSSISGKPQIARDAVLAVIGAVVGWLAPVNASRGEMALYAAGGAIGAVLAFELVAYAWRFIWSAPKQMHFDSLAMIARIERERDEDRTEGKSLRQQIGVQGQAVEVKESRIRALESQVAGVERMATERIGRSDWQRLAEDFANSPGFEVSASWHETSSRDKSWRLTGGPEDCRSCETLCRQAGTMLMKSPNVFEHLSGGIVSQADPTWRWFEFVGEHGGGPTRIDQATEVHANGEKKVVFFGFLEKLKAASVRACRECATWEM